MEITLSNDFLNIGGKKLKSRLLIGTGKYASDSLIPEIADVSESEVITVALRRVDFDSKSENVMQHIPKQMQLLPNTSGARNADEAVRIAKLAREMGCGNWIKIEVITDSRYLLPDGFETIKATEVLVKDGFVVLPYMNPDLYIARSLVDVGAAAVMPLGAPIGTNKGLQTREMIRILIQEIEVPVIVDAGIGKPSEACTAMEMGADACLVNTAIATAKNPVQMASAFKYAVNAGRQAYLSGIPVVQEQAVATSPLTGFLDQ